MTLKPVEVGKKRALTSTGSYYGAAHAKKKEAFYTIIEW
jgi:hypothetical protein